MHGTRSHSPGLLPTLLLRPGTMLVLLVLFQFAARAQEMVLPSGLQVQIFLKAMTFDRNLKKRSGDRIVVGVLYQKEYRESVVAQERIIASGQSAEAREISSIPLEFIPVELPSQPDLRQILKELDIDVLYIVPLRAVDVGGLLDVTRSMQVVTVTGVPEYVERGVSMGFGVKGEKPLILVNLNASRLEGAEFTAQFLKLTKICAGDLP